MREVLAVNDLRYQVELLSALNNKLTTKERMCDFILNTSANAFIYQDFEENQIEIMGNWDQFFDFKFRTASDYMKILDYVDEKYIDQVKEILFLEKIQEVKKNVVFKVNGKRAWYECDASIEYNEFMQPIKKVVRFKDVSKNKMQNDELAYMAYYDVLTGLYNRNYFVRLLGEWLRRAQEENSVVAVLFIDIDDFRKINDGMGIVIGDEVVQIVGQYLGSFGCENIISSHINSDIFCMAIYNPCNTRSVEYIHSQIQEHLKKGTKLSSGEELNITVSIGVAEYPEAAKNALELINCAEIVMFKAKASGKNAIQYFDAPILNEFLSTVQIENKLREAIFNQNFSLKFQPQYYIKDNKLRGVEALIRWRDDDGNMISPAIFIPIAEKNGTIIPIGNWVMGEAIRQFAGWKKKYGYEMTLSLNISALQYKRPDFIDLLMKHVKENDVRPEEIELEITETVLIDDFKAVIERMLVLQDYGFRVSLDDFGTGYSSLSYLSGLPLNTIKIDKAFIDSVLVDHNTKIVMESIIQMVHKLGYESIAEGIESNDQVDYLKEIGCDVIQGYLLGKPLDSDEIEELIRGLL